MWPTFTKIRFRLSSIYQISSEHRPSPKISSYPYHPISKSKFDFRLVARHFASSSTTFIHSIFYPNTPFERVYLKALSANRVCCLNNRTPFYTTVEEIYQSRSPTYRSSSPPITFIHPIQNPIASIERAHSIGYSSSDLARSDNHLSVYTTPNKFASRALRKESPNQLFSKSRKLNIQSIERRHPK